MPNDVTPADTSETPSAPPPARADAQGKPAQEGGGRRGRRSGSKNNNRGKGGGQRRSRPPARGLRNLDLGPPRFDVGELAELAGPPLWQSIHEATVVEVTDAAVFIDVKPRGLEPLRAMIDPRELKAPSVGDALVVRLLDPAKPARRKSKSVSDAGSAAVKETVAAGSDAAGSDPAGADPAAAGSESSADAAAPAPEPAKSEPAEPAPLPIASVHQARALRLLDDVMNAKAHSEGLPGRIVAEVKGGFTVALGQGEEDGDDVPVLRAFLPKSQGEHPRLHELTSPVGEQDVFDLTEVEPERANVVVSRKKRLNARYKEAIKGLWNRIQVGDTVTGKVRALVAYGAFVDLGGVDALLHASDISWDRQPRPASVLKVGETVTAQVVLANKETGKIKIGLKQLIPNPWNDVKIELKAGSDVEGDVVALTDYGAFVRVKDGVEGLIHLSEVSWNRVKHVSDKFSIGERITARVLDVDLANRRISLSTKALEPNPFAKVAEQFPKGTVLRAKVKSLTDFGAFVSLNENVDGLIHIGEMSWTEHVTHPSQVVTLGEEVEVVVLDVDVNRQRVACSVKQLTANPWKRWEDTYGKGKRLTIAPNRVTERGAFFELEEGLSGYCSTRDLTSDPGLRASDIIKVGQEIEVEVKMLDRRRRQVQLSARAVVEGDTRAAYDEYKKKEAETGGARTTFGDAFKGKLGGLAGSDADD